ncbi:Fanconi anemia group A protein homolog [Frankliniella occidentalis]|uniref:Fanconi anemia group A protein homolog n=1 Tax=Frankliniella occidentalis TaxID=133901 RepID=A0A6J1RX72_FRAOC|nr:Fanconi anemia group A protein homolog [Frankliniella occidentalis]
MENLKVFLEEKVNRRSSYCGEDSWVSLNENLNRWKEQDVLHNYESAVFKVNAGVNRCDTFSLIHGCVHVLHSIARKSKHPFALVPEDCKKLCTAAMRDLQFLKERKFLDKHVFVTGLLSTEFTFPLEVIWELHKADILQISSYVLKKFPVGSDSVLSSSVLWLLLNSKNSPEYVEIVIDVFASLLSASQSGPFNVQLSTICAVNLKKCTDEIIRWVLDSPPLCSESIDFNFLSSAKLLSTCGSEAIEQFILTYFLLPLCEQNEPNSIQSLLHAVEMQEKTTLETVSNSYRSLLVSIVRALGDDKVVSQICAAVVKPSVNFKVIFLLTAAVLSENPECCENFQRLIDELIQLGLEGGRQTELSAGFLLARHCCTCDSKTFSTYSSWFSSYFGPDSATARNAVHFQSLMQLLTDIVPVDSAENLRVHINKVPQAPTSCNSILHDYTVLARTRLADLNETSELAGLFSDSRQETYPGLDFKQGDIVKVLLHYQQTNEVMKPVLEASIFRRTYFRNIFLVELLGLPGSSEKVFKPEEFGLNNTTRHDFILALKAMGKVPDKLFRAYTDIKFSQEVEKTERLAERSEQTEKEINSEAKSDLSKRKRSLQVRPKRQ